MPQTRSMVRRSVQVPPISSPKCVDVSGRRRQGRGNETCFKVNPLMNDLVLSTLFGYVQVKDLKSCRLVCMKWHTETLPFVRSHFQVRILGTEIMGQHLEVRKDIQTFMKLIGSSTLKNPFQKFTLGAFNTTTDRDEFYPQFLQSLGESTKEIVFNSDQTVQTLREMLQSATKLECLKISTLLSSKDAVVSKLFTAGETKTPKLPFLRNLNLPWLTNLIMCPTLYEELFLAADNISTLSFSGFSIKQALQAIEKLGRESSIQNLTTLDVSPSDLVFFRRMANKSKGLELKKLDLCQTMADTFPGFELVEIFKNTLIDLRVTTSRFCQSKFAFPLMPKLKNLYLSYKGLYQRNPTLTYDDFTTNFPAIEKLQLDFGNGCVCTKFANGDPLPTSNTSIRSALEEIECLDRIISLFPTLRTLECFITMKDGPELIKKIFTHMTQLESLSISGNLQISENLDSLVTGISVYQFNKIDANFFTSLQNEEIGDREVKIRNMLAVLAELDLPSIRNLENLKSLTLKLTGREIEASRPTKYLTELFGYFGLYSMKNLRNLMISDSKISKSCCEILTKDNYLVNWKFLSPSPGKQEIILSN